MKASKKKKHLERGKPRPVVRSRRPLRPATLENLILAVVIAIVVLTPLVMWRALSSQFSLPKFIVLTVGSSVLIGLLSFYALGGRDLTHLRSRYCLLISLYLAALGVSTIASLSPGISFFGSISRRMGFISYVAFIICFYAVVVGIGRDRRQLLKLVTAIIVTGFVVSSYGIAQIAGLAPVAEQRLGSGADKTFRIDLTLGHPNYAGNLLLFFVFTAIGLAFATTDKKLRLLSIVTSFLAIVALGYTGTRGAWVGLLGGLIVASAIVVKERGTLLGPRSIKSVVLLLAGVSVCVVLFGAFVMWADAAAPLRTRISAFWGEGFTGAGRTLLWRLSITMLGKYWATGTGLEMFRVAFLPYKTANYPEVSGGVNPEDPHSAYLSSFISSGILAALIYLILLGFALRFFYLSITNARDRRDKLLGIGLLSSFVAVLVHNVFIFHLIPTGLYFFIFLALSYCWYQITREQGGGLPLSKNVSHDRTSGKREINQKLLAAFCSIPVIISIAYSYRLFAADQSVLYCRASAEACNYSQTFSYGSRATSVRVGQSDYHSYFAMALERLANKCTGVDRVQVLENAIEEMEKSLDATLLTEVRLAFLAELNLAVGKLDRAEELLHQCETLDPYATTTHLIRTKLFIARGDHVRAREELKLAKKPWIPGETIQGLKRAVARLRRDATNAKE